YVGGAADGLTCLTAWQGSSWAEDSSGGPSLTADPVADCQRYQELTGAEPIPDPVAFTYEGYLVVAPRSEVPADGEVLAAPTAEDAAAFELDASLQDHVDGVRSGCFSEDEAVSFAARELERQGLTGWTVAVVPADNPGGDADLPCAVAHADPATRQAQVLPHRAGSVDHGLDGDLAVLRDALRAGIAERCVGLPEAEALATAALGAEHHWPLSAIPDPDAACTRVDLEIGGSVQVTLRGPEVPRP
ncbi:hypothetical protein, partial [Kineococcus glutinatus]|uniref:hypothetical protein n=1 Tax=Kineococcus glutinatus TaxID=1070872 RepID=UPI0031E8F8D7